jgi:hypothetical protein
MKHQIVTIQEFDHFCDIPTEIGTEIGYRLIHFTTTIRSDNSVVMVLLWEKR